MILEIIQPSYLAVGLHPVLDEDIHLVLCCQLFHRMTLLEVYFSGERVSHSLHLLHRVYIPQGDNDEYPLLWVGVEVQLFVCYIDYY